MTQLHEGRTFTDMLELVERVAARQAIDELGDGVSLNELTARAEQIRDAALPKCPIVDSTGQYVCNRPAKIYRADIECHVCERCNKEMP